MTTTIIGIDAHKNTCTYVAKQWDEILAGPTRIKSTREALTNLAERFPDATFVIEACSVHEWMHDTLTENGADVVIAHPFKREAIERKKSDPADAERLATKYQVGEIREVHILPPEHRRIRDRIRYREFIREKRTSFKTRIRHELNRWGYKLDTNPDTGRPFSPFSKTGQEQVLEAFPHLESAYQIIEQATDQMDEIQAWLEKQTRSIPEVSYLESVPGIGTYTAAALFVEIGTITRFPNAEHLVSYFGLDPVKSSSGDRVTDEHRISKKGTSYIRGLLNQCARVHVRFAGESSLTDAYHRLREAGKEERVALTAVMRKLVKVVYWLLRDEREFMLKGPAPANPCRTQPADEAGLGAA